ALPTVVDLVCLAVTAGESLRGALAMVADTGGGPLAQELRRALRTARGGTPLADALEARARVLGVPAFNRFVAAVVAAQERGIPLADALRSLAFDLREHDKRELIEVAGKKQISMLVPVVMLILPVAIVFAFYPGVVAIRTLAR
ncbi:MAG: type II secretion system F family protein, partial [Acidimicrobiia bacterium]|nr:type II secretion system F family protein [Acidimicrobiia bacterium]